MRHLLFNPVVGALLNCFVFGLADVYVGRVAAGLIKIVAYIVGYVLAAYTVQYFSMFVRVDLLQFVVGSLYIVFASISGYRTVLAALTEIS